MKIPNEVRLNGIDYAVNRVSNLVDDTHVLDGQIDYNSSEILLNTGSQGYQAMCITFLHEIFHGILYHFTCAPVNGDNRIPDTEEELVELLARGVYQFLQDNGGKLFDLKGDEDDGVRSEIGHMCAARGD